MSFFQQKDQEILMFPESAYLTPLNGTKVTANPATYPWYSRLNVLPDGLDWDMPIQIKEKIWGVGAGKHPSNIINTEFAPVDITLDMYYQDARFLSMAIGSCATSDDGTQSHDLDITCLAKASITGGDYFLIYTIDSSGVQICNAVWYDVTGADSGPSITGATNIEVDISAVATATEVATATAAAITANANYTATSNATVVSVTVHGADSSHDGAVLDARDGASATDFTFSIQTHGASTHTITELTDNTLKSFGLHIEYDNGSEDIVVDLFGCIVTDYELSINYDDKIIKESVTIRAPYYAIGTVSTIPPPRRTDTNPAIWANLAEAASTYVLMLGTTDKTPAILTSLTFTVSNEVDMYPEIGASYRQHIVAGKRNVGMSLVGFIQTNDLWTYWYDTWNDAAGYYTNAAARLNTKIKIERTATHDTMTISVYNWLIEEYGLKLFTIDDKIMGIDIKLTGATPNSSGYIIDSFVITDYTPKIFYGEANT